MKFQIDRAVSRFTVQAFATGLLSSFGHSPRVAIRDYEVEIQCIPETYEKAFVRVTVQTGEMEILDEMKRDDRARMEQEMYDKVLDVRHHPAALYESNRITIQKLAPDALTAGVDGELSFHGVTQPLPLQANITVIGTTLRISGNFTLRQSDYDIKPVSVAAGALRLKDELKFTFDLVARRQD
ncbi:MAG TPA: YceI family protein [Candidatus Sulfotelmatobacter sp.]|nr:YceI family protein [Candidatus Sulfotelmatobacter sp.]